MGVFNPNSCLGSPFASDGFIPHSGSSSSLLRTTSPFPPQLHCYLSSRPKRTPGSPPPASCNSFIQFSVQGLMCSRPPPPRSHQKKEENYAFFFSFSQSVGPLELKTRATNRFSRHFAPVLSGSSSTGWNIHTAGWSSGRLRRWQNPWVKHAM